MTAQQQRFYEGLTEKQQGEYDEYRAMGLSIDAALNLARQHRTGHEGHWR